MIWLLVPLMLLSGLFGRMGGAGKHGHWYDWMLDTKWRDIGCSIILILAVIVIDGYKPEFWLAYLLTFGLTWASFCTYWDKLFGYDNLWFSGFVVGLAGLPLGFINKELLVIVLIRVLVLTLVWGCLNKFLPQMVLIWKRDVVEEFGRYFVAL